jgi:hypothetical protein
MAFNWALDVGLLANIECVCRLGHRILDLALNDAL